MLNFLSLPRQGGCCDGWREIFFDLYWLQRERYKNHNILHFYIGMHSTPRGRISMHTDMLIKVTQSAVMLAIMIIIAIARSSMLQSCLSEQWWHGSHCWLADFWWIHAGSLFSLAIHWLTAPCRLLENMLWAYQVSHPWDTSCFHQSSVSLCGDMTCTTTGWGACCLDWQCFWWGAALTCKPDGCLGTSSVSFWTG